MSSRTPLVQGLGAFSRLALDALLPPQCLACGEPVAHNGALCAPCWDGITFLAPPHCALCGYPFEFDQGPGALCAACIARRPRYARARAVLRYDEGCRRLLLSFKHGDRTEGAPAYGAWLARAGAELLPEADLIVPVPLHWTRLFSRRYNQAALLAQALARASGLPVVPDLLWRRRATPSQGHLSRASRQRNVAGAFAVRPDRSAGLRGRRVILVDDVMTTGATAAACSATLLQAGAADVDVLVLARALRAGL